MLFRSLTTFIAGALALLMVAAVYFVHLSNGFFVSDNGVGNIALKGSADNLEIESEGVGNINTRDLKAQHVKVSSEGVGNISCYASGSIDIKSEGVGNVSYYGNPELKTIIKNGVGRVSGK